MEADQVAEVLRFAYLLYWTGYLAYGAANENFQTVPSKFLLFSTQCRCLSQIQRLGNSMRSSERVLFHQLQEPLLLVFVESSSANFLEDMRSPRFRSVPTNQISNC